ncbi:hypothetical protein IWW50_006285 [Coemansia erecta]|nr:hypothetical protein GGF43_000359 [Coemansia sp. RSA 2618]KAJ2817079.1 hypothetical protein IWW50_006285 [Coemansia erecta]
MALQFSIMMTAAALAVGALANELPQNDGPYPGNHAVVNNAGGVYLPADIIEVGYAPQTAVAVEQFAAHRDGAAHGHVQFNNGQGARAGESASTDQLFRTRSVSASASESSESEEDTSGLDTSAGARLVAGIGASAVMYTIATGILSFM